MKLIKSFCIMVLVGLTFFSCSRPKPICVLTIYHAEYIYHNKTDKEVELIVKKDLSSDQAPICYTILPQQSITIKESDGGAYPFDRDNVVILKFTKENKCVTYNRYIDSQLPDEGVFDLKMYADYDLETVRKDSYTLNYHIDEKDYAKAIECQ